MSLVAAMAVSFGTMDWISGGVIAALVILNVSVGGYTEWQAEKVSLFTAFDQVGPKDSAYLI